MFEKNERRRRNNEMMMVIISYYYSDLHLMKQRRKMNKNRKRHRNFSGVWEDDNIKLKSVARALLLVGFVNWIVPWLATTIGASSNLVLANYSTRVVTNIMMVMANSTSNKDAALEMFFIFYSTYRLMHYELELRLWNLFATIFVSLIRYLVFASSLLL
jgi:hypothetical protein